MRKTFPLIITALFIGLSYSCENKPTDDTQSPVFEVTDKTVNAGYEEGTYTIRYTLSSPAPDGEVTAEAAQDCDWISECNTDTEGEISFKVAANSGERRESTITVSYTYSGGEPQTCAVSVVQSAYGEETDDPVTENGFTISVTDITFSTATISITPEDPTMQYLAFVVEQSRIEGMTDDDIFNEDMMILESQAAYYSTDLKTYLEQYRLSVGNQNRTQGNLDPGVDYYVYCYGVDNSGDYPERTTGIVKYSFTTKTQEITENGITLDVEITGNVLSAIATPYTNDRWYVVNWNRDGILTQAGYTNGTPAERCEAYEYTENIQNFMNWGFTIDQVAWQGPKTVSTTMMTPDTYYVFAYFVNSQGQRDSEIMIETIEFDGSTGRLLTPSAPGTSLLRQEVLRMESMQDKK